MLPEARCLLEAVPPLAVAHGATSAARAARMLGMAPFPRRCAFASLTVQITGVPFATGGRR